MTGSPYFAPRTTSRRWLLTLRRCCSPAALPRGRLAPASAAPARWPGCRATSRHQLAIAGSRSTAPTCTTSRPNRRSFSERADDAAPAGVGREALHGDGRARSGWGPTTRLSTTRASASGSSAPGGVWEGDLYLRGGGDPTFGASAFIRSHYGGSGASVSTLVTAARAHRRHPRRHAARSTAMRSFFDSPRGEPSSGYAPDPFLEGTLSGLAFDRGASGSEHGRPRARRRTPHAQLWAALKADGVEHPRLERRGEHARRRACRWRTVRSPTVAQLLGLMLPPSDNFFAETLVKDLGARLAAARARPRAGARGRRRRRSPRCSASTRAWSTARASPNPTAPRPTRWPTCWSSCSRRRSARSCAKAWRSRGAPGRLHKRMRSTRGGRALSGQDGHAHRRLQPRRLLPGRQRPPARVRVLQRRHLDDGGAHLPGPHGDHAARARPGSVRRAGSGRCGASSSSRRPASSSTAHAQPLGLLRASTRRSRRRRGSRSSSRPSR